MNLADWLNQGAGHTRKLIAMDDPAPLMAAAGFTRMALQAEADRLAGVSDRCIVSDLQRQFLIRVLALLP